jgi:hypothetical protein
MARTLLACCFGASACTYAPMQLDGPLPDADLGDADGVGRNDGWRADGPAPGEPSRSDGPTPGENAPADPRPVELPGPADAPGPCLEDWSGDSWGDAITLVANISTAGQLCGTDADWYFVDHDEDTPLTVSLSWTPVGSAITVTTVECQTGEPIDTCPSPATNGTYACAFVSRPDTGLCIGLQLAGGGPVTVTYSLTIALDPMLACALDLSEPHDNPTDAWVVSGPPPIGPLPGVLCPADADWYRLALDGLVPFLAVSLRAPSHFAALVLEADACGAPGALRCRDFPVGASDTRQCVIKPMLEATDFCLGIRPSGTIAVPVAGATYELSASLDPFCGVDPAESNETRVSAKPWAELVSFSFSLCDLDDDWYDLGDLGTPNAAATITLTWTDAMAAHAINFEVSDSAYPDLPTSCPYPSGSPTHTCAMGRTLVPGRTIWLRVFPTALPACEERSYTLDLDVTPR